MSTEKMPKTISLIGMSNSGKSYWSDILEKGYGYQRISIDEIIMNVLGFKTEEEMAHWLGKPDSAGYFDRQNKYLHEEEVALEGILATLDVTAPTVIDTTGSVVFLSQTILEKLAHLTTVVWLYDESKGMQERVEEYMSLPKPVIWRNYYEGDLESSYAKLYEIRKRFYNQWAHIKIDTSQVATAVEFTKILGESRILPYEFFLQQAILPTLEKGRPHWDRPHTESVVWYVKEIISNNPALQVDPHVLIISAYIHDYGYSELYRGNRAIYPLEAMKRMHARRSVDKWKLIEQKTDFAFLKPEQKEKITHLIEVHDDLEKITTIEERVFIEADTLGALSVNVKSQEQLRGVALARYLNRVKKNRIPLFVTDWSKKESKRLITILHRRTGWLSRLWGGIFRQ